METVRGVEELGDRQLLMELERLVGVERRATAEVLAHVGEVDARGLYRDQACSSMFEYCVKRLRLSEGAAYRRIRVARAARKWPVLLEWLAAGRVHLSGLSVLVPHLTADNCEEVLGRAEHRSKRELEEVVAELAPKPDVPSRVRKLPQRRAGAPGSPNSSLAAASPALEPAHTVVAAQAPRAASAAPASSQTVASSPTAASAPTAANPLPAAASPNASVSALAPERYAVQFTADKKLRDKLETARELMRHQNPTGDLATVVDRALDLLVEQLMNRRFGKTSRPRKTSVAAPKVESRHIPRAVRREVFARDAGRCTFTDGAGRRCEATGFLEFHHQHPYALGGAATVENIAMLCRAHNGLVAERELGAARGLGRQLGP